MNYSLLKLQIGPVQDFIAQARSTRDLWSGSYLLSWLMAAGAKALVEELSRLESGGTTATRRHVISPSLADQPLLELHLAGPPAVKPPSGSLLNDERLTPNFTNILIAELPPDINQATPIAAAVESAIREEWRKITEACWDHCRPIGLEGAELERRWQSQIDHFPGITWQVTPAFATLEEAKAKSAALPLRPEALVALKQATDTYAAQAAFNSWQLDAVRQLRGFRAWSATDALLSCEKDSLTGREEAVLGGKLPGNRPESSDEGARSKDWWARHIEPKKGEGSLWTWLFRERQRAEHYGALSVVKRVWHSAYLKEKWDLDVLHRPEPRGKEFPFPSTFHIASHDPAKNESADRLPEEESDRQERYFAVLALDGDEMGKWLSGEKSGQALTKDYHSNLSKRLGNFALHCVRPIVDACDGRLIYAGGEDVLALLPADTAIACAQFLRAAYRAEKDFIGEVQTTNQPGSGLAGLAGVLLQRHEQLEREEAHRGEQARREISPWLSKAARRELFEAGVNPGELQHWSLVGWQRDAMPRQPGELHQLSLPGGLRDKDGHQPDVSAGLAIAHFKEPLQDVVQAALAAEKRAKNDLGRAALAVTLVKHSGETVKWGCKWESGGLELLDLIQRGRGQEVLSSRFPHRLVEVLSPYLVNHEPGDLGRLAEVAGFNAKVDDLIAREFALVLARQSNAERLAKFVKAHAPENHLRSFLAELVAQSAQDKLRAIIGLCQVAAFIEPVVHSPDFLQPKGNL